MEEMHQSVRIIQQCIDQLPPGPIVSADAPDLHMSQKIIPNRNARASSYGTGLISLSKREKSTFPIGDIYIATEVPKGELGFYFISDGSPRAYRMHIRSPSFIHISSLPALCEGSLVADLIANIGSLDVVLGESDI